MKNISIIAVATCLALSSCNDDTFLREIPEDFMTIDNSYLNVNQFKTGLNQMYSQVRALYNSNDGYHDWTMMGIGTDVLMIPSGNGKDQPFNDWGLVNTFNGVAGTWWNTNYSIIKNCNELLFQTENPQVNWSVEGQKEEVQAEIRFFRAFAYRNLGHIFGGVPLLDKPITEPTLNFVRSTRTETYKFALEDAKFAATYLPKEVTQDGRVVRATADHLLAELYIAYSDNGGEKSYDKAIEAATRVIDGTDGDFRLDRLLSCSPLFSMGKWIKDAKDCAASEDEKNYYEENARGIVTIWGQKDTQLNDYANRGWAGLTKSFYRERWKLFTDGVLAAMKDNRSFDEKKFHKDVTEFEYQWTLQHEDFPISSGESAVKVANELWNKYQNDFR